jgi:hypoxanthine phosphoribosyltransferase
LAAQVDIRFSAAEIATRIEALATEIAGQLPPDVLVVAVLKGSFVFTADLIRALSRHGVDWPMDFITLSSYGEATASSGTVRLTRDINEDVKDRVVLLIDDILESGRTLSFARDLFLQRGASKVWLCTLLDKPMRRAAKIEADFSGFRIGDEFVVGYGLDHAHRHRGLPYIGVKKSS